MEIQNLIIMFLFFFFAHLLGETLQDRETAQNKSHNYEALLKHGYHIFSSTLIGTFLLAIIMGESFGLSKAAFNTACFLLALVIASINTIIHLIIDKFIWNLYPFLLKRRFSKTLLIDSIETLEERLIRFKNDREYAEDNTFYNIILLDQFLHYTTVLILGSILILIL